MHRILLVGAAIAALTGVACSRAAHADDSVDYAVKLACLGGPKDNPVGSSIELTILDGIVRSSTGFSYEFKWRANNVIEMKDREIWFGGHDPDASYVSKGGMQVPGGFYFQCNEVR